jgi:PAS domain S-box-containing protein
MVVLAWLVALGAVLLGAALVRRARAGSAEDADSLRALDAVLDFAPLGVAVLDTDLRFVRANQALLRLSGQTTDQLLGHPFGEVTNRPDLLAIAEAVLSDGEPAYGLDASGRSTEGRTFQATVDFYPVRIDDRIVGVGVIVHDITAAARVDEERRHLLERLGNLQRITESLALARSTHDVVRTVVHDIGEATQATAATLVLSDEDKLRVLGTSDDREAIEQWMRDVPASNDRVVLHALAERRVVVAGPEELAARWPTISRVVPAGETLVAVPLLLHDGGLGALVLRLPPSTGGRHDEVFLTAVAVQTAEALSRVRREEAGEEATARSAVTTARLALVAEASEAFASSLDWRVTLRRVADLCVPRVADVAIAFAIDGEEVVATELAGPPTEHDQLRALLERWPHATRHRSSAEPALLADLAAVDPADPRAELAADLVASGLRSAATVALRADDRIVGLLVLVTSDPRALDANDLALAVEIAGRAGQAMRNAARFQERAHVADTLQASLLPPATPSVPGLEVATRFFAVGEGIDVGGDFYDVFRMGTAGAPFDQWAVVIGDVRGKGAEAARISGTARHAIRTAALHERSPSAILRQLNELLLVTGGDDLEPRFCTAVVAVVTPESDAATITLAVAGHPAPLLLRSDGTTEHVTASGTMLGVLDDAELGEETLHLGPGDALVLYTDGVTERHVGGRFFDEETFASVLSRCTGFTAPVLAERIETASRAFLEDLPSDDLAVVVVRVPEPLASASAASTDLPNDVSAPILGRRFVAAALGALGLDRHAETAALLASELVTNALVHADPPYRIAVESGDGVLRIAVNDASTTGPQVPPHDVHAISGRGIRLVDSLTNRWGVVLTEGGKSVWFELDT